MSTLYLSNILTSSESCIEGKHNWAYRLRAALNCIVVDQMWEEQSYQTIKDLESSILEIYRKQLEDGKNQTKKKKPEKTQEHPISKYK